jgi:hypothetical protein
LCINVCFVAMMLRRRKSDDEGRKMGLIYALSGMDGPSTETWTQAVVQLWQIAFVLSHRVGGFHHLRSRSGVPTCFRP